jgi:ribosomal protein L12E/L44/L45/RPP1/RPP2
MSSFRSLSPLVLLTSIGSSPQAVAVVAEEEEQGQEEKQQEEEEEQQQEEEQEEQEGSIWNLIRFKIKLP